MSTEFFLKNFLFVCLFISVLTFWIETIQSLPQRNNKIINDQITRKFDEVNSVPALDKFDFVENIGSALSTSLNSPNDEAIPRSAGFASVSPTTESNQAPYPNYSIPSNIVSAELTKPAEYLKNKVHHPFVPFFFLWISFFTLTSILILRWIEAAHPPLSNLYESLLFLTWNFLAIYLFFTGTSISLEYLSDALKIGGLNFKFVVASQMRSLARLCKQPQSILHEVENQFVQSTIGLAWLRRRTSQSGEYDSVENARGISTSSNLGCALATPTTKSAPLTVSVGSFDEVVGKASPPLTNSALLTVSAELTKSAPNKKKETEITAKLIVGFLVTSVALFIDTFAEWQLPEGMREVKTLIPALQSNWLLMHVSIMILSYSSLFLGCIFAILYSMFDLFAVSTSLKAPNWNPVHEAGDSRQTVQHEALYSPQSGVRYAKQHLAISSNEQVAKGSTHSKIVATFSTKPTKVGFEEILFELDNLSYKLLSFGFPLLTLGILSGSIWANEAWGSYWSWDPKETWAFITWLVFAFYLHTRLQYGWSGKKSSYVASFGFFVVWICYLGVNLLGKGLHSYGWISS